MMVNWEFFDDMTPHSARELVDGLRAGADVAPTRGAPRLCTWRQASRILAGFPDDQAAQGHTAGHATLAGLRIAKEHGWEPPAASAAPDARPGAASRGTASPGPDRAGTPRASAAKSSAAKASPAKARRPGPVEGGQQ